MKSGLAILAVAALAATTASGEDVGGFAKKFFGRDIGAGVVYACFARVYDAQHLAKHPRQNVTDMALMARIDSKTPDDYALSLGLHLRKSKQIRITAADCSAHGDGPTLQCSADCEGGKVDIKLKDDGSVWLTFPHNAAIWSPNQPGDAIEKPTGLGGDDLVFRLDRGRGAFCAPLAADKETAAALKALH